MTSFNPPVGGEGQSNCMRKCRKKDRDLQHFPKGAFELLPPQDLPILDTIAGADGPGWYPGIWTSEQLCDTVYPLATDLPAFDYVRTASARDESCVRKLMLGQVDYMRFAVHLLADEYVP